MRVLKGVLKEKYYPYPKDGGIACSRKPLMW